jgi:shikimate 5-dehydrogenase
MPLFDDPVAATLGDDPVLWLGTETDKEGIKAVILGPGGHASAVMLEAIRANMRLVDGAWLDVDTEKANELRAVVAAEVAPTKRIYDSFGNAYTADGDPIP